MHKRVCAYVLGDFVGQQTCRSKGEKQTEGSSVERRRTSLPAIAPEREKKEVHPVPAARVEPDL